MCSLEGGYFKCDDWHSFLAIDDGGHQMVDGGHMAHRERVLDAITLVNFIQATQPKAWERFERMYNSGPVAKFVKIFDDAVDRLGMVAVPKHGFKHRGITFKVASFQPESGLNDSAAERYSKDVCRYIRQFHLAPPIGNQTIDMVLEINDIPVVGKRLDRLANPYRHRKERQWSPSRS